MKLEVVFNSCFGGYSLSNEAERKLAELGVEDMYDIPRHHPLLIRVVKELGEKASGYCARLCIDSYESFKKSIRYRIHEYDGSETVYFEEMDDWIVVEDIEVSG